MKLLIDFHYSDSWADPASRSSRRPGRAVLPSSHRRLQPHLRRAERLEARAPRPTWCRSATRSTRACCCRRAAATTGRTWLACSPRASTRSRRSTPSTRSCCTWPRAATTRGSAGGSTRRRRAGVPFDVIGAVVLPATGTARWATCRPTSTTWRPVRQAGRGRGDGVRLHPGPGRQRAEHLQLIAGQGLWLPGERAGPGRRPARVVNMRNVPNGRGLGVFYWEPRGPPWPGRAGTRPTPPRATAGRTRPCSTTTTGPAGDVGHRDRLSLPAASDQVSLSSRTPGHACGRRASARRPARSAARDPISPTAAGSARWLMTTEVPAAVVPRSAVVRTGRARPVTVSSGRRRRGPAENGGRGRAGAWRRTRPGRRRRRAG